MLLQTNLAESQQSFLAKEDHVQHLIAQLGSAHASAADLAKRKEEVEEQLQQQKERLETVKGNVPFALATHYISAPSLCA